MHAGEAIFLVHPLDFVHAAGVYNDNHALFVGWQLQGATDAGSAAVGHEADVVNGRQLNDFLRVRFAFEVKDQIGHPLESAVEDFIHFVGRGLAVAVDEPFTAVLSVLAGREGVAHGRHKRFIVKGSWHGLGVLLGLYFI